MLKRLLSRLARPLPEAPDGCSEPAGTVQARYLPSVFDVDDLDQARRIILTDEQGLSSDERWRAETPYLVGEIVRALSLREGQLLLDYGCGVGRLSRALIEHCGCRVVGVDISSRMRKLAGDYVAQDGFCALSPGMLARLVAGGLRFDAAIAVWVLQHCPDARRDLQLIRNALHAAAPFFVLNNEQAAVPTDRGWLNDGTDIRALLADMFTPEAFSRLPARATSAFVSANTFTAVLRNSS